MTSRAASMIVAKRSLKWAALVAIALIGPAQLICGVRAFSLPTASKQASPQPQPAQQSQSTTSLPALLTTIAQENAKQAMGVKTATRQPQQPQHLHRAEGSTRQRSSNEGEHDDMVPLATINNHSRNNQAALRPPQYVDVSALVGARNSSGSPASLPAAAAAGANSVGSSAVLANSMLSAKSRSGLPECATQQVCNAIFVRMNHTQRLCECSSNYNWKCSNTLDPQDGHTIELTRKFDKRIYTQIKTCEPLREVRACKSPTDWTLLALQSERSGKAHYVVVCKCPTWAQLEGPYTHNHPPYANIPGIRVYGMLCAHQTARSSTAQTYAAYNPALSIYPEFPWSEALNVLNTTNLASTLDAPAH